MNMGGEEGKKRRKWRQFLEGTRDLSPSGIFKSRNLYRLVNYSNV